MADPRAGAIRVFQGILPSAMESVRKLSDWWQADARDVCDHRDWRDLPEGLPHAGEMGAPAAVTSIVDTESLLPRTKNPGSTTEDMCVAAGAFVTSYAGLLGMTAVWPDLPRCRSNNLRGD